MSLYQCCVFIYSNLVACDIDCFLMKKAIKEKQLLVIILLAVISGRICFQSKWSFSTVVIFTLISLITKLIFSIFDNMSRSIMRTNNDMRSFKFNFYFDNGIILFIKIEILKSIFKSVKFIRT